MSRFTGYAIFALGVGDPGKPVLVKKYTPHIAKSFHIRKVLWYSTGNHTDPDTREIWTDDGGPLWGPFFATEQDIYVTKANAYIAHDAQLKEVAAHYRSELENHTSRLTRLIKYWDEMIASNQQKLTS